MVLKLLRALTVLAVLAVAILVIPATSAQTTCASGQAYIPSCGRCVVYPVPTGACAPPTGGAYNACGGCVCPSGKVLCGLSNTCVTVQACPTGTNFDPCLPGCTTPYILKDQTTAQGAFINITGNLKSTEGDLYLTTGKAIRVDNSGLATLNMGNWGGGAFSLNVAGDLSVSSALRAGTVCLGTDCRTAWPGGGSSSGGLSGSGTANYLSKFTAGTILSNSTIFEVSNNIGIGTTNPGGTLTLRRSTAGTAFSVRNTADSSDTFAVSDTGAVTAGSVPWARLTSFPTCPAGQYIQSLGDILVCGTPSGSGTGGLSGSGAANKIAFWTSPSALGQNANLHWDNVNSKLGVGTAAPVEKLEISDGTIGAARLRISDTGQNPEFQLQYGTGADDHWAFYVDQTTQELRLWRGDNRLTLKNNGDLSVSGCLGAVFVGVTEKTYNGTLYDASGGSDRGDGYLDAKNLCDGIYAGSHICSSEEILTSIQCGNAAILAASGYAWVLNGPPAYFAQANDCGGWSSTTANGTMWEFSSTGGKGHLTGCNTSRKFACCR